MNKIIRPRNNHPMNTCIFTPNEAEKLWENIMGTLQEDHNWAKEVDLYINECSATLQQKRGPGDKDYIDNLAFIKAVQENLGCMDIDVAHFHFVECSDSEYNYFKYTWDLIQP